MNDVVQPESPDVCSWHDADRFLSLLMVAEVLLVGSTLPLWTTVDRFPAVPLVSIFSAAPVVVDQCCTAVLCLAAVLSAVALWRRIRNECAIGSASVSGIPKCTEDASSAALPEGAKQSLNLQRIASTSIAIALVSGCSLVLLNQHRLQPWHWLFLLIAFQSLALPRRSHVVLFRLTIASIYIFAAASRLGPEIDSGMSRQVLNVAVNAIGVGTVMKNETAVFVGCVAMTSVEFLTGVMLLTARFRRLAVIAAIAMHATLILILSPLGLNHHLGVLVWNAFLLLAAPLLFWHQLLPGITVGDRLKSIRSRLTAAVVVVFPLSGLFAFADNWLSWQVYSPRPEVVRVYVHEDHASSLPSDVLPFVGQPAALDVWCPVRIDRWALSMTSVPLYPEDRFQLAVAAALLDDVEGAASLRIMLDEPGTPTARRQRNVVINQDALNRLTAAFVFNGRSLRTAGWNASKNASLPRWVDE